MKTALTLDLEKTLFAYWQELGVPVVEEVTMPQAAGIVDSLARQVNADGTITWRCFELKVTKADFHSGAKWSFVGDYNYFVLPARLYPQVADAIPAGIGVMTYRAYSKQAVAASTLPVTTPGQLTVVRPPRHQALAVPAGELETRFVASLNREVVKAKRVARGLSQYSDEQLLKELQRRSDQYAIYDPEDNLYDHFADQLQNTTIAALQAELDALAAENAALRLGGSA